MLLLLVAVAGCQAAVRAQGRTATCPDLSIGAEQFPDDDAILLRWEHHWTLERDGTVRQREHRWVKLLHTRAINRFGDPRIDFCDGQDKLVVHTAQTILPNGDVVPVQPYSYNLAAADDVLGWPSYAGWRQQVLCFSGIENNVVLDLDYEVTTHPGIIPWANADLRLDDDYPTVRRIVSITVPAGTSVSYQVQGQEIPHEATQPVTSTEGGTTTFAWTFVNLPGAPAEPQSPPWRQRCPRLCFTTCPSEKEWVTTILHRVEAAAEPADEIKKLAEAAVKDEGDPAERVRKVVKKLRDSFNFLDSPKVSRSYASRPAAEVLRSNYGNPLESAALCGAALKALGLDVSFHVAADAQVWSEKSPTDSAFAGVVVVAAGPDGPVYVHPQKGPFRHPGSFGRRWLFGLTEAGELQRTYVAARGEKTPSEIQVTGKVTIDPDGKAAGELRLRLTGAFYDPQQLETSAQQETLISSVVGRVFSDFKASNPSIAELSDDVLRATVKVTSKEALKKYADRYLVVLGTGPALVNEFPLPLARSYRRTAVYLGGPVRENIDLTIELPEGWTPALLPTGLDPVEGPWGSVCQQVDTEGRNVRFRRTIALTTDPVVPDDFAVLREALNDLRAAQSLNLVCGK